MGLLDQVGAAVSGVTGKGQGGGLTAMLLPQLMAMLSKPGALDRVMGAFRDGGLGKLLQSWTGTGENLPISPDQTRAVLGEGTIAQLAKQAGAGESETAQALSGLLPQVIDKLTPRGKLPSQSDLGGLMSSVGKLLG